MCKCLGLKLQINLPQQAVPFVNAQMKPKVSSPAPSKIYGRPGSLSTDPIKHCPDLGMKSSNQSQDRVSTGSPTDLNNIWLDLIAIAAFKID